MNKTNNTNNVTINKVQEYNGDIHRVVTCKATIDGITTKVTYNRDNGDVVIHSWYKMTKETIEGVTAAVKDYFAAA